MKKFIAGLQFFADEAQSTQSAEQVQDAAPDAEQTDENSCDSEFEELIKGKYKDSFARRTQSIIDRRFAKTKGFEQTARAVEPLIEKLKELVPDGAGKSTGELVEQYLGTLELKNEGRETTDADNTLMLKAEAAARKKAADRTVERWEREAEELKDIYPSFSLEDSVREDKKFVALLRAGLPVRAAYEAANMELIMAGAMKYAAENAGLKTAQSIRAGGRVQENSVLDRAASVRRKDVNSLTEKDIMKIITDVSKGAKITF